MTFRSEPGQRGLLPGPAVTVVAHAQVQGRTAEQWLAASREQYASVTTYAEDGRYETLTGRDGLVSRSRWQLRYARAGGFAFRYEQRGFLGVSEHEGPGTDVLNRARSIYAIWQAPGAQAQTRWSVREGKLETKDSLDLAVAGAFGVTDSTSGLALAMLGEAPRFALRQHPLGLRNASIKGVAEIDGHACVVIAGEWLMPGDAESLVETTVVYIDTSTLLVRRWERENQTRSASLGYQNREVFDVRPLLNPTLDGAAFAEPTLDLVAWEDGLK
jgi:hypothetical protein